MRYFTVAGDELMPTGEDLDYVILHSKPLPHVTASRSCNAELAASIDYKRGVYDLDDWPITVYLVDGKNIVDRFLVSLVYEPSFYAYTGKDQ